MTSIAARWNRAQNCCWLGSRIALSIPIDFLILVVILICGHALVSTASALDKTNSVADGELRACQIVSVDNAWAVGDRGLILSTGDAGKHWEVQHQRSDAILYGVCFSDELNGCVVGGTIEPYSHRSAGAVLVTNDGGKSWQLLESKLPFRSGVVFAKGKWIVVGTLGSDWSNDNGTTWQKLDGENYNAVSFAKSGVGWAAGPKGRIAKFGK